MNIALQKANQADLQTVTTLLNDGTRNKVSRGDLAWGTADHNPNAIQRMLDQGILYLAVSEQRPVGVCALAWQDQSMWGQQPTDAGYIQRFAIAGGQGGQQIGTQMLDLMLAEVEQNGRTYLRLAVPSGNAKLRSYYESRGFTRADHRVKNDARPVYTAAYYERHKEQDEVIPIVKSSFLSRFFK